MIRIQPRVLSTVLAGSVVLASVAPAAGDSIHLKNGRVIRTVDARIEGERVVFVQYGSMQSIPLAIVERIEEDERVGPGSARPTASGSSAQESAPAATAAPPAESAGAPGTGVRGVADSPAARLQALGEILGGGAGVDPAQALGLLKALGGQEGSGAPDLAALAPLLGALGGGSGSLGDLGALGGDLEKAQTLLPLLSRLGQALFAPEYSQESADEAVDELLRGLAEAGVTEQQIRDYAQRLGVSLESLRLPRR